MAFYLKAAWTLFPAAANLAELQDALNSLGSPGRVFVYVGEDESRERVPAIADWKGADAAPPWLAPVAGATQPENWVLFEFRPQLIKAK